MSNDVHPVNTNGHGDYERRDIGIGGVLYFMAGLAVAAIIVHFVIAGLYRYLENRSEAQQKAISPLVTNPVRDTRTLPPQFRTDDYVDKDAGTVRIPIDRAMDLLAQRGLPTRTQSAEAAAATAKGEEKE